MRTLFSPGPSADLLRQQTAQLVDKKVRGPDLITMQLPRVTPPAATHTTHCEDVVFANNGRQETSYSRGLLCAVFSLRSAPTVVFLKSCLYTFQIKPTFFSFAPLWLPVTRMLSLLPIGGHPRSDGGLSGDSTKGTESYHTA